MSKKLYSEAVSGESSSDPEPVFLDCPLFLVQRLRLTGSQNTKLKMRKLPSRKRYK